MPLTEETHAADDLATTPLTSPSSPLASQAGSSDHLGSPIEAEPRAMKYLLLINKDEAAWRALDADARAALEARYAAWGTKVMERASSGARLEHADTATTVRVREGRRLVTDGPFAETEEQIAGIVVIEARDLDEALEIAAAHPDAAWGSVEVRPVMVFKEGT